MYTKAENEKSTGPDNIPNEALIKYDRITRAIYMYFAMLNEVYHNESIPIEWQEHEEGEIIIIYKVKGEKGKCSNERGIALASNIGKVFERLINNHITHENREYGSTSRRACSKATEYHIRHG